MKYVLVDTGVWIAMLDPKDQHHASIDEISGLLKTCHIILPWPILYETLRTKLVRNRNVLKQFKSYLNGKRPHDITFIDDEPYREDALELSLKGYQPLSMVDCLIRLILEDIGLKVDYLATFNFRDFNDVVSANRQMAIIPNPF